MRAFSQDSRYSDQDSIPEYPEKEPRELLLDVTEFRKNHESLQSR
jgi:hypothetical protein